MSSAEANRSRLQLQAEHALLQLEENIVELDRRRRDALRIARWVMPMGVLLVSATLLAGVVVSRRSPRKRGLPRHRRQSASPSGTELVVAATLLGLMLRRGSVRRLGVHFVRYLDRSSPGAESPQLGRASTV